MKEKVGIGILGTGFARKVQIPAFSAAGADIVSVASATLENARSTAEEYGIGHFTDDWRETVSRGDVDLVVITTPPNLHLEMALFSVEQGKHVLCEKPMAMTVAEAETMAAAASGKPLLALIDHELRFQDGRQKAYEMLRNNEIGTIRHVRNVFQAPHRGDPNVPWNWWSDIKQGGGALGAIVSHIIDSFNWFLGTDISSVYCQLQTHVKQRRDAAGDVRAVTTDDQSNLVLRFSDGALTRDATGLITVSMTDGPEYRNRIEFFGDRGAIRIDHLGELFVASAGESKWNAIETDLSKPIKGVADTGFARGFMAFAPVIVDAIRSRETSIPQAATFEDGVKVQRVLDAARESDASGRVVSL